LSQPASAGDVARTPLDRLRVLVLSHYFWPEPIPKPLELAEALRDQGHGVEVVTGFPNYPSGELYPGFTLGLARRDHISHIPVRRMFMYPDHGTSRIGRVLNYGSFMLSAIVGGLLASPFDVMYVWHPPLSIGLSATAIARLRRRAFVYDVQDIWPESAIATGYLRPGRITRWMTSLEKYIYKHAAHILVVTDGAKKNLIEKGVPGEKITVAPHWYDDGDLRNLAPAARQEIRARHGWCDRFVVMFAGNIGALQGLDTVLRACPLLPSTSKILMVFVGDGSDKPRLMSLAQELGIAGRVEFIGRQPQSEIGGYFAAADALLVHLRDSPLAPLVIPSKTVAYLAAGKPILMASVGAAADLVARAAAGITLTPDDPNALAQAAVEISNLPPAEQEAMGQRGRRFFQDHFTKAAALPLYLHVLRTSATRRH
jgi:colanic acid biosynthesis glycosyl transferase WcaI